MLTLWIFSVFLDASICLETPTTAFMPITAKMQPTTFLNYFNAPKNTSIFFNDMAGAVGKQIEVQKKKKKFYHLSAIILNFCIYFVVLNIFPVVYFTYYPNTRRLNLGHYLSLSKQNLQIIQ